MKLSRIVRPLLAFGWLVAAAAAEEPAALVLPTANHALFENRPEAFYMHVDRTLEDGTRTTPWEGGTFGFVRTPVKVNGQTICRQFHEGIDIAPVRRDAAGNPLDGVGAIAAGTVVHVSDAAGASNYGRYVVVEHLWESSRVYSLYAHLATISCKPGDRVNAGDPLAVMGFTGAGINRVRAHLHLEIGLLLHPRYEGWHAAKGKGVNRHGIYNGMNFAGADPAGFFLARRKNPQLRFSDYVRAVPAYFKVAVPAAPGFDFPARYPWLLAGPAPATPPPSWEISFSATGLPVAIAPGARTVAAPTLVQVRPSDIPHRFRTRYLLDGEGSNASLRNGGMDLLALITGDFPDAPPAAAPPVPAAAAAGVR